MEITPYGVSVILLVIVAVGAYWRITWQLNGLIAEIRETIRQMDARQAQREAEQAIRNARLAADNFRPQ